MKSKKSFAAVHRAFERKVGRLVAAVGKESVQALAHEANRPEAQGGRMPVVTSFLRNSLRGSTGGMPTEASKPVELALLTFSFTGRERFYLGWTAAYARRMEHGFHGPDKTGRVYAQPGKHFAATAAQKWPQFVAEAAARVAKKDGLR